MGGSRKVKETLFCMTKDIRAVLIYYPVAVMTGFIGMLVYVMICKKICHRIEKGRMVAAFLFFTYVIMLLNITYFSREPGSRSRLDLQLFSTWDAWPQSRAYFVENILLFLPFGCFLPIVWPQAENVLTLALSACMISIGIEMAQYITGRGYSQLDDIVTNTAGAVIGYLLFFITAKIIRLSRKRKEYRGKT